jgi:2-phosphosulfolactate phosphatase
MTDRRTVVVDCFPESVRRYDTGWAIVAVDVIRATTTAVTAVAGGRRCFPVASLAEAVPLAAQLDNPLLVGELGGRTPEGFDLGNSPSALAAREDIARPMILLSTSGTRLMCAARQCDAAYAACFRNVGAQVRHLAANHPRVAVVGAGARGEFRQEDQMCCAWIAEGLIASGYRPLGQAAEVVARWRGVPVDALAHGESAAYLRRTDQVTDLLFILTHLDDLDAVFRLDGEELVMAADGPGAACAAAARGHGQ